MSGKRLASATFHYGLAAYLPRILNFILLPMYATRLSPSEMGVLEVMTAVDTLVVVVSRMGLPSALSRSYFDDRSEDGFRDQLVTTSVAVMAAGLLFSGLVMLIGPYVFAR